MQPSIVCRQCQIRCDSGRHRPRLAQSGVVDRLQREAPLNEGDQDTFYGGGAEGYTDYPTLEDEAA